LADAPTVSAVFLAALSVDPLAPEPESAEEEDEEEEDPESLDFSFSAVTVDVEFFLLSVR
jgi:hypothetical protein